MKKRIDILLVLAILSISQLQGQTGFEEFLELNMRQTSDCLNNKDYNCAVTKLLELENKYNSLSGDKKNEYNWVPQNVHYDMACCYALTGKEEEALTHFEDAIKAGYINYAHAKTDPDLDTLRKYPKFEESLASIREEGDYTRILQKSGPYIKEPPAFSYQEADAPELVKLKEYFKLDSIAGSGDETSKILNLLTWSHNLIRHDGSHMPDVSERTAISFYEYTRDNNRGMNCRAMAIFLNECYLAMGFKSYYITCMPKKESDPDCHVINSVYSTTLGKWVWVDPTFNAWVTDENKNMLSIRDVRRRIINDEPVFINEDANWNNENKQTKEMYIDAYMAKNLYYFSRYNESKVNADRVREHNCRVALLPLNYRKENIDSLTYYCHDEDYFWEGEAP